jgi:hypothetical protein
MVKQATSAPSTCKAQRDLKAYWKRKKNLFDVIETIH